MKLMEALEGVSHKRLTSLGRKEYGLVELGTQSRGIPRVGRRELVIGLLLAEHFQDSDDYKTVVKPTEGPLTFDVESEEQKDAA